MATLIDENWQVRAACRGPETHLFFAPSRFERRDERSRRERRAKEVCARCSVSSECLQQAMMTAEPFGIWGGQTESERRRVTALQADCTA
ncbi:MAG: WhiB family transcriptional regulator [Acidimicrobiia bacterium]|jgi:WhiB family redox-sensing transcriptional regulator|nr:WhiB family transcriptional regulator [Acidimicrobiia bacterium]MBP8179626.1 WhiB family transcriptional regulator [Acidimicrobiia bacterium]